MEEIYDGLLIFHGSKSVEYNTMNTCVDFQPGPVIYEPFAALRSHARFLRDSLIKIIFF